MTAPGLLRSRGWRWWGARVLLVGLMLVFVMSAAGSEGGRSVFLASALAIAGLIGHAWYREEVTTGEVLLFAGVLRLLAFPLLPGLSDDGYRYIWDGWLQVEGLNPYLFRPNALGADFFDQRELFDRLNSASYYSVYPPASQLVFLLGGLIGAGQWGTSWFAIKGTFLILEAGGVWALSRVVSARSLMLYAWHPLVIIEIAGQAHTEAGMVGFLLLSLWAYRSNHPVLAVGALTVAGWFKLYPFLLLPFLLRRVGWRYVWVPFLVSIAVASPYVATHVIANVRESLDLYVRLFEYNAGPYFALKKVGYAWSGQDWSKILGPSLRIVFLLGTAILFTFDRWCRWDLAVVWCFMIGLLWATSTTVHPWYLVGLLAILPLTVDRSSSRGAAYHAAAWLWLSVASLGTYLFYTTGPAAYWISVIVGWSGWALGLILSATWLGLPGLMRYRAEQKWRRLGPHLGAPTRILDLGAGEGYVGEAASKGEGISVVLADVVDFNRTDLPLTVYDGRHLPFDDDAFDGVVLVFVLHHTEDAYAVLHEVRRITQEGSRVGIIESVTENRFDRWWLPFADRLANRVRSGGQMDAQEEHLHFRTAAEWRKIFASAGFQVVYEQRKGWLLHKQTLFVLE